MDDSIKEVDATGDAIITLRNPNAPFAAWPPDRRRQQSVITTEPYGAGSETQVDDEACQAEDLARSVDDTRIYRVSSRHLINASAKFRSEFTGAWTESLKKEDGYYHLSAYDWDADAFEILLDVIHLRNRQIPKKLSLEMVAKVAVLVDYYRCWEAFDLVRDIWKIYLRRKFPVPEDYNRDLILWIIISWVFKLGKEFEITTKIAIEQSSEAEIYDMELGIPPIILSNGAFHIIPTRC